MFNQASQITESMTSGTMSSSCGSSGKTSSSNMGCNGLTTSDQDLRRTKNELFSKLVERQPQQAIISPPNKTISEENISNSMRLSSADHTDNKAQLVNQKASCTDLPGNIGINLRGNNHVIALPNPDLEEPVLFSRIRSRWYTNDEVASILTNFSSHPEWQTNELQVRPQSGAVLLYSREKVRYRQDGYCWKKRKNGRTTREDHMKLKVQGIECIYGCYVHSALLPTFHRRCYWLLENPDIVLVHYLNQPPDDKGKMVVTFSSSLLEADTRRRWTNEEIIEEIGSVFGGISHIHQTLSINFPTVGQQHPESSRALARTRADAMGGDASMSLTHEEQQQQNPHHQQLNPPDSNCDTGGLITLPEDDGPAPPTTAAPESIEQQTMNYSMDSEEEPRKVFEMTSGKVVADEVPSDDRADPSEDDEMIAMNQDDEGLSERPQLTTAMGQTNKSGRSTEAEHGNLLAHPSNANSLSVTPNKNIDHAMGQEPCSPVTQIYNKIVDDIETYVLPLEMNQFDPNSHDHHHHHSHHQSQHVLNPGPVQMMDTNDQDPQRQQSVAKDNQGFVASGHHGPSDIKQEHTQDMSPVELLSCDLFTNCNDFGNDQLTGQSAVGRSTGDHQCGQPSDMLLANFNLRGDVNSNRTNADNSPSNTLVNPDELRNLMMGISTSNGPGNQGEDVQQSNQLLLECETTDTMELFDFKQLDSHCEHEYRHQLDVKSTTSETDTLNRLSPVIALVPRCNSTDNAVLQMSSIQRHDNTQYQHQHHASSQFLSNSASAGAAAAPVQSEHLMQSFPEFENHHHHHQVQQQQQLHHHHPHPRDDSTIEGGVNRSATATSSTEPSNSTSCSASSLINAGASGTGCASQSGASFMNSGACSGVPSVYQGTSSTDSSSFIKLPLPQRQNSEQREPSNSVLSSLLPKALSLDGSDLSSTGYRSNLHHYYHNHHHHHHHHQHQSRTSPLIGSYHRGGGGGSGIGASSRLHTSTFGTGCGNNNSALKSQANNHMLLIPPNSNQQLQLNPSLDNRHYYQRPSAPSLSPSSGNYSLDSSSSCSGRVFASGGPYRSGSVASSASVSHLLAGQQPANVPKCSRLRTPLASHARLLPILDYVPNWSHSAGGTKVLLIGNWTSLLDELQGGTPSSSSAKPATSEDSLSSEQAPSEGFVILFDDLIVSANLIQDNVLRCYSPQREPGFIALKVVYRNFIVSEQVLFEIRSASSLASTATSGNLVTAAVATTTATIATTTMSADMDQSAPDKKGEHLASIK